jgi:hypothetical protein
MAKEESSTDTNGKADIERAPRCLGLARKGIRTGSEYADITSALMSDLIEGLISPQIGNAVCNAGGKLLKVAELQIKYGKQGTPQGTLPTLRLVE